MITVVGSANMDLVARVDHLPQPGETVLAGEFARVPGGKGANQAVAAARAGSRVEFVGRLGEDEHGDMLRQSMEGAGVSLSYCRTDLGHPSGTALITVDAEGGNSIVVVPGANGVVQVEDVDQAADAIAASSLVIVQLEIPLGVVAHAVEVARAGGAQVLLNPAPAQYLKARLPRSIDILVANEAEVAELSGVGFPIEPASAARLLLDAGIRAVVVTMGPRGGVIVTSEGDRDLIALKVEAVDTTGAGDAFVGNLAHGLDSGLELTQAALFATAAAAVSVQRPGAQPSTPTRAETEALLVRRRSE